MSHTEQMREALEEIALAGMSGTGQESQEAMDAWHARQAWRFIAIAARALDAYKAALTAPAAEPRNHGPLQETDLYDFAGWLTTRRGVMTVGSSCEAGPMAEAVSEYIKTYPERFAPSTAAEVLEAMGDDLLFRLADDHSESSAGPVGQASDFWVFEQQSLRDFSKALNDALQSTRLRGGVPDEAVQHVGNALARQHAVYLNNASVRSMLEGALTAAPQALAQEPSIEIDFKQATELLEMFGGEPSLVTLMPGDGHSGKGLYAYWTDIPGEGAIYLGVTDDEATPQVPAAALDAGVVRDAEILRYAMDWDTKNFAVCMRVGATGQCWEPIKTTGPIEAAMSAQAGKGGAE